MSAANHCPLNPSASPISTSGDYSRTPDYTYCDRKAEPLWPRIRRSLREPFAEFLGCMILIIFGTGSVAQVVLSKETKGSYQSISWGWGIGVMFGVYIAGGISGAHLNPAVTLANCVFRKFPYKKLPSYIAAQVLGCYVGAAIIYGNYRSAIDQFEGYGIRSVPPRETATAGVFCTYPAPFLTRTGQFFSEVIASAVLMMCIFAIGDQHNNPAGGNGPLILFFLIFGIGACLGWETGYAINLARDFGPRLFTFTAGYGTEVWSSGNYYFWIPMVAPFFGCLLGGGVYDFLIFTGDSPVNKRISVSADTESRPGSSDITLSKCSAAITDKNLSKCNTAITDKNLSKCNAAITDKNLSKCNAAITDKNLSKCNAAVTDKNLSKCNAAITDKNLQM
ncbi:Aquaporin-7 [Neolecta irregularis DAH-3]|uniref:Aquaporin-7 n=1 Tax=Neolecta irregularis (strain DAH-3) TaxID=1198029 RepID=A0A1U7LQH7_NEOID|nr:Aquaporin-7 [Neolecta irregularis DAH-3]|eukprot:OLL24926.1 Aquaporin-7 [Neolecta irregularis DAH-3]